MDKIEVTRRPYDILRIAPNNTELLRITPTGEVIAPSLEAASEAGRFFVQSMRGHLEVMREAIRAEILATRTDATPVAWMPIESAPKDGTRFLAWCPHAGRIIMQIDGLHRHTWGIEPDGLLGTYPTHWQPIPAAPDHIEEPRAMVPAPDVAALVEAAKEAARGFDATNVLIEAVSGSPSVMVETFAERLRQALAAFTKGQP